jgi:hypothetical protein
MQLFIFIKPDPFVQSPTNPQSYNRYAYCWNNPLKYTDPTGYTIGNALSGFSWDWYINMNKWSSEFSYRNTMQNIESGFNSGYSREAEKAWNTRRAVNDWVATWHSMYNSYKPDVWSTYNCRNNDIYYWKDYSGFYEKYGSEPRSFDKQYSDLKAAHDYQGMINLCISYCKLDQNMLGTGVNLVQGEDYFAVPVADIDIGGCNSDNPGTKQLRKISIPLNALQSRTMPQVICRMIYHELIHDFQHNYLHIQRKIEREWFAYYYAIFPKNDILTSGDYFPKESAQWTKDNILKAMYYYNKSGTDYENNLDDSEKAAYLPMYEELQRKLTSVNYILGIK